MTDSSVNSSSNNSSGKDASISNTSGVTYSTSKTPEELMAEDKLVKYSRYCVAFTLLISAATLSIVCYFAFRNQEENNFKGEFNILADEIERLTHEKFFELVDEMHELTTSTTSLIAHSQAQWPNVTIPYFQEQGVAFRELSQTKLVIFTPTVSEVDAWSYYSEVESGSTFSLHDGEGNAISSTSAGPFNPTWQMTPLPTDSAVINLDLRSVKAFRHAAEVADVYNDAVVSEITTTMAADLGKTSLPGVIPDHPHSFLVQPINDTLELETKLVGFFVTVFTWELFLGDILHTDYPMTCVVENSCGDVFTFDIQGDTVHYVGQGDHHDRQYDHLAKHVPFVNSRFQEQPTSESRRLAVDESKLCVYTLRLYPTQAFEDVYMTNAPMLFSVGCIGVFIMTALAFVCWDMNVKTRQNKLAMRVQKTNKIVSAMFPKSIQAQLLKNGGDISALQQQTKSTKEVDYSNIMGEQNAPTQSAAFGTKPVADLYVATTVSFMDICGFTAWSSVREPTQVFQLLEAIFSEFDKIARKMGVFKVETVGDCYVAVAGMPEPREDHAILMAMFMQKCQKKMKEVTESLEIKLGPDTGELALRCGLHSGPVTAGVLRGERARLQLFGDTMNTTSRIETSGKGKKIHVSPETAQLLKDGGKEDWLELRDDLIVAKGKGAIQTYWLKIDPKKENKKLASSVVDRDEQPKEEIDMEQRKLERLIDWNCDILVNLLKKLVYKRQTAKSIPKAFSDERRVRVAEQSIGRDTTNVIGEIAEIIVMPADENHHTTLQDTNTIELDAVVVEEVRNLVTVLSKMYHTNPFHCFEHASHVTMSVTKLLSRIEKGRETDGAADKTYGITSDPLTQFALVFAALIHDVDHRGVPNFVLIKQDPTMAAAYNNQSIAEQNSVDLAWHILMDDAFTNLRACLFKTEGDLRRLRQLVVNSVMATDIFDKDLGAMRKKRWADAFHNPDSSEQIDTQIHRKATIVIEHLIQASDVSHTMQHWHVYQKWNERLFEEMYLGYKAGLLENDPSVSWYAGEIGFFDNYIIPLTKKLKECGVFGVSSDEYLNYATNNRAEWEKKGEDIVQKFLKKYA